MLIAFEGPDNVGKSTSAQTLDYLCQPTYNATKRIYEGWQNQDLRELVHTFDRIDWLSHMVYRLAYPTRDWNDDRPRTVFAMPDTHLVLKVHDPSTVGLIEDLGDGLPRGSLAAVSDMYCDYFDFLMRVNRAKGYSLYKTISVMTVTSDPGKGMFRQRLTAFDSPYDSWRRDMLLHRLVDSDATLLEFLRDEDRKID